MDTKKHLNHHQIRWSNLCPGECHWFLANELAIIVSELNYEKFAYLNLTDYAKLSKSIEYTPKKQFVIYSNLQMEGKTSIGQFYRWWCNVNLLVVETLRLPKVLGNVVCEYCCLDLFDEHRDPYNFLFNLNNLNNLNNPST